jgi:hypothetical protein
MQHFNMYCGDSRNKRKLIKQKSKKKKKQEARKEGN